MYLQFKFTKALLYKKSSNISDGSGYSRYHQNHTIPALHRTRLSDLKNVYDQEVRPENAAAFFHGRIFLKPTNAGRAFVTVGAFPRRAPCRPCAVLPCLWRKKRLYFLTRGKLHIRLYTIVGGIRTVSTHVHVGLDSEHHCTAVHSCAHHCTAVNTQLSLQSCA